eukprot:1158653-Pelagomonas_calceolata.AAC.2
MPTEKAVCMRKGPLSVSSNVAPHFLSIAQGQISNMVALQEYSAAEQKSAEQRVQVYKAIWWVDQNKTGQVLFAVGGYVAVTSMAGWLIGLGDRHSSNILLDTRTAAVVHIDLGVAFEQGRFLRTPELVPFRMTPDVMDGCGIAGCEGPLRRSCELTMQVLRSSKEALLQVGTQPFGEAPASLLLTEPPLYALSLFGWRNLSLFMVRVHSLKGALLPSGGYVAFSKKWRAFDSGLGVGVFAGGSSYSSFSPQQLQPAANAPVN